jgi:phytoene dehydrogenase-like protein
MSSDTEYDAIVIGAGPNGLTSAAYLQQAGNRVLLCERRHETGGGLNTDEYYGFRLNLHAIYHLMAEKMPAWKDLNLADLGLRYLYPHVVAAWPFKDGTSLVFTRDVQETVDSIAQFSPDDAQAYLAMWQAFQPMLDDYLIPMTYELPMPALDQLTAFNETPVGEALHEISEMDMLELIDFYGFTHPRIRMALLSFPAMWGINLEDPLGFLFPLYLGRMMDAAFVKGGSHRLSSALFRSFVGAGGNVIDENEVTKIIMEEGAAVGVRLADGSEFRADAVISTLNPVQTFEQLLTADEVPPLLSQKVEKWEWEERSLFGVHLGIDGAVNYRAAAADPRINQAMTVFLGPETEDELLDHLEGVDDGSRTGAEWLRITLPSVHDATMAPPGHSVLRAEAVVAYDPAWRERSKEFAACCIELIKDHAELGEVVLQREVSPVDIEQKLTTMTRGSYKHGAYSTLQLGFLRPNDLCSHSETPIEGLYLGGASLYPGGMILGACGYLAAQVVGEFLDKPIVTHL